MTTCCGPISILFMSRQCMPYLVVGCGLSGITVAERLANVLQKEVIVIDRRDHIGGNCYDYVDKETGILMNKYGAHLFHTNSEEVWEYVNKFDKWVPWEHKVISKVDDKLVPMPANIDTVNALCGENIKDSDGMDQWLRENQVKYDDIKNSEQMAKSRIGEFLYEKLVKHYTYKQWNKYPCELDPLVLARIPVRNNFDDRYFTDRYQALPHKGYTEFMKKMLDNPRIKVLLNTDFFQYKKENDIKQFEGIVFTGQIDKYFQDSRLELLEYRIIDFNLQTHRDTEYFQTNSVVNYPGNTEPYTRIVEYKHFLNQKSPHTIVAYETTNDTGEPYYPVPNDRNKNLYEEYRKLAIEEEKGNVHFLGRLASYKYFNMDQAILAALNFFNEKFQKQE